MLQSPGPTQEGSNEPRRLSPRSRGAPTSQPAERKTNGIQKCKARQTAAVHHSAQPTGGRWISGVAQSPGATWKARGSSLSRVIYPRKFPCPSQWSSLGLCARVTLFFCWALKELALSKEKQTKKSREPAFLATGKMDHYNAQLKSTEHATGANSKTKGRKQNWTCSGDGERQRQTDRQTQTERDREFSAFQGGHFIGQTARLYPHRLSLNFCSTWRRTTVPKTCSVNSNSKTDVAHSEHRFPAPSSKLCQI